MKVNWYFILGIIFGMAFIGIGMLNNLLTDRQYAHSIGIFLMVIWMIGVSIFMRVKE